MKKLMYLLLAAILLIAGTASAESIEDAAHPKRVLFVGNSYMYYNDGLHSHVRRLLQSLAPELDKGVQFKLATIGGASLSEHAFDFLLDAGNLGVTAPYEVVILQGASFEGLSEKGKNHFLHTVHNLAKPIASTGARPMLYMTPAYDKQHSRYQTDMTEQVADMYMAAGKQNNMAVIPVGLAFQNALVQRPYMALHKHFDHSHPSILGTYLASCVVIATLYGLDPVGSDYRYYGEVNDDEARFLQQVAKQTVESFIGKTLR